MRILEFDRDYSMVAHARIPQMKQSHLVVVLLAGTLSAQSPGHQQILALVSDNGPQYQRVSKQIWDYAELGYHEEKSSALLQEKLKAAGFNVEKPMADMPTAFVASYGSGKPVIGILAEFDALPGLSQERFTCTQACGECRARPRLRT